MARKPKGPARKPSANQVGDVTVSLTGAEATMSAGTLAPSSSVGITGVEMKLAAGFARPSASISGEVGPAASVAEQPLAGTTTVSRDFAAPVDTISNTGTEMSAALASTEGFAPGSHIGGGQGVVNSAVAEILEPADTVEGTVVVTGRPLRADWAAQLPAIIANAGQLRSQWQQLADHVRAVKDALPIGTNHGGELDAILEDVEAGYDQAATAYALLRSQQSPQASSAILEALAAGYRSLGRLARNVALAVTVAVGFIAKGFLEKVGGHLAEHQMHDQAVQAADLAARLASQILSLFQ